MLVWPLCELSSFMMVFWPLSQIRRLCVQLVGVLCVWDVLTGFACFWGVLVDVSWCEVFSAAQLSCLMLCLFLDVPRFPYEREFMLFCCTMIWWYFMLLRPLRDFLIKELSCFSALMRCHEISSRYLMLCLTPPMRWLCFYLMRFCAVFAAQFSGKTSSWDGLHYAISYCWRQSKDCLVRCHSCRPPRRNFLVRFCCCLLHICLVRFPYEITNGFCSTVFPMRFPCWCFLLSVTPVFL